MIEIKNLTFSYNEDSEHNEIENLSLSIASNQHVCILGHNGSGKSTLAKLMSGLLFPNSGTILINGVELNKGNTYDVRSHIGVVFQNPDNQFIGATVQDDIAFGLENKCVDPLKMPEIIEEFSKKVGMYQFLKQEPSKLSGGQKQRVAIAGILAMDPNILIFDEATSMLDPQGVIEVNESIIELNNMKDKTIISITHDMEFALNADYIIVLNKGQVLFEGEPNYIFTKVNELKAIGLDIPFYLKISNSLNEAGYPCPACMSLKELDEIIWESK